MTDPPPPVWRDPNTLRTAAYLVAVLAGSWWLLGQLAGVLRPLLLATFLAYVLLPWYARLRRAGVAGPVAVGLLAGAAAGTLAVLAAVVYGSLFGLSDELPRLKARGVGFGRAGGQFAADNLPWLKLNADDGPERYADAAVRVAQAALAATAFALVEAVTAGLYLLFLLIGAERLPGRVRAAYPAERAEAILHIGGRINAAIVGYLRAKVKSSLLLAVPAGAILAACDVRFALLWGVLTFLCNFIPYIGSVLGYGLPVAFALLQHGWGWPPAVAAGLLLALHLACALVVEPLVLGKAVGLSPLVILAALAVWGTLWDLPGMFLAVPLTVVVKLVLENFAATRPVARLAEE